MLSVENIPGHASILLPRGCGSLWLHRRGQDVYKRQEVTSMRKILPCEFNMDTACVELRLENGTLFFIDCTAVENEVANSMYQRSELEWLI